MPFHSEFSRWFTGGLALLLLTFVCLKPALLPSVLWLAKSSDHEHQILIQSDGDHLDIRLSHAKTAGHSADQNNHQHDESAFGLLASLCSTHDHEGSDHVLHFNLSESPDQIRQRPITITAPTKIQAIDLAVKLASLASIGASATTAVIPPAYQPPLPSALANLRTVVLVI